MKQRKRKRIQNRISRSWFRPLLMRRLFVMVLMALQIWCLAYLVQSETLAAKGLRLLLPVVSWVMVFYIVTHKSKGAYKVAWVTLVLAFPLLGGILYLLCSFQASTRKFKQQILRAQTKYRSQYLLPGDALDAAAQSLPPYSHQFRYLQQFAGFPVYDATQTTYYSPGEAFFPALLEELQKARSYIFLEYFTIDEGWLWGRVLDLLRVKASQGVRVRILYDDVGCFLTLPTDYAAQLQEDGIQCAVFNPFRPFLSAKQNNRDHRKIAVVDGTVAFTGGINLADEYINLFEKHGHWKDAALKVEGKAAWSLTLMFLEMWELSTGTPDPPDLFYHLKPEQPAAQPTDGFVQPYADSPMDEENVGEHVYLQILNSARDYVYITTPYLIVDDSMVSALCLAAKSGVDVRIITPHIWDKKLIHMTTLLQGADPERRQNL